MTRPKKSARVLPLQKRVLYSATAVLWLTGVLWLLVPVSTWPQTAAMKIHGAFAMVFLMVFGTMLFEHVPAGWLQREHRLSGVSVLSACAVLMLTGWCLYYVGTDMARFLTHWIHTVLGVGLPLLIYLHVQVKRRIRGLVLEPTRQNLRKGN